MVAVFRTIDVPASADQVWDVVGNFEDPVMLAPGFAVACEMVDGERLVSFADGGSVREALVSRDELRRRLSYAAVAGQARHHHAVMHVVPVDERSSRIEWVTEVLPDHIAGFIEKRMDEGAAAIMRGFSA